MAEQPTQMAVKVMAEPWIRRPKIKGNFTPAKRGLVKTMIFDSLASMSGSDYGVWSLILKVVTAFTPES